MSDRDSKNGLLERLSNQLLELSRSIEHAPLAEYIEIQRNPWRLLSTNFLAGLFRGFGIAIGFTAVSAVFLYALGRLASLNLPVIGEFIAEIARLVELELSFR